MEHPPDAGAVETTAAPSAADREHIESLFTAAKQNRSRAYELKQELDRLGLFHEFEDRFLDLFKEPD
jgi:uncharacterized protein